MTIEEQMGIIAGLAVAAALLPKNEPRIRELADALQRKWKFGPDEFVHHEFLCKELRDELPRRNLQ